MAVLESESPWHVLGERSRAVAVEVLRHGPLSRAELAARLALSAPTVTRLSRPLLDSGVLVEAGEPHVTPAGRPGRPLRVDASTEHVLGVRVSTSRVWAVAATLRADVVAAAASDLPDTSPSTVTEVVADLVHRVGAEVPTVRGAGVAVGGSVGQDGTVRRAPFLGWEDVPLARLVRDATGVPVVVENDVVALTSAESWFGTGRRTPSFAVVTLGEGVGMGLVHHGRVVRGQDAGVGLIGHLPLGMPGPRCDRGHVGCASGLVDAYVSAAASAAVQRPVGPAELLDLVQGGGHPGIARLAADLADGLGLLVAVVAACALVPAVLVTGEGVALAELLQHRARAQVARHREPAAAALQVEFRRSDGARWARGAAVVALQRHVTGPAGARPVAG